jgi:hypothetical protein
LREEWALQVSRKGRKDRKEGFRVVVFLLAEQFQEFPKTTVLTLLVFIERNSLILPWRPLRPLRENIIFQSTYCKERGARSLLLIRCPITNFMFS